MSELCELEKDFEDEFFFECEESQLEEFYQARSIKTDSIRLLGKIIEHMETDELEFTDPFAEGAALMIKGIASYIGDNMDIPNYLKKSTRTGLY